MKSCDTLRRDEEVRNASAQATIAGVGLAYVAKQPPPYFHRELDPRWKAGPRRRHHEL